MEEIMKKRKHYTPKEKVEILKRHLVEREDLSELCETYGIQPSMFYRWQKQFFENGAAAFPAKKDEPANAVEKKIAALEEKLKRKNEVLGELMEEHMQVKKNLGVL